MKEILCQLKAAWSKVKVAGQELMEKKGLAPTVFLVLIATCFILTLGAFVNQAQVSEKENRALQKIPQLSVTSYINGDFFRDLELFFYDNFPMRDLFLDFAVFYNKAKGIQPEIMALEKGNNMSIVSPGQGAKGKSDKSPAEKPVDPEGGAEEKVDFSQYKTQTQNIPIMAVKDTLMELYHFDENKIASYTDALNRLAEKMPRRVQMYSMLVPTQVGLKDDDYRDFSDPQSKAIEYTYSLLNPAYKKIDVFTSLYQHKDEYIFFRTDHHWTQLGAYYGAEEFAKVAGLDFDLIDKYEKHSFAGFLGYLYNNNQVEKVAQNPDQIDAYVNPEKNSEISFYTYQEDGTLNLFKGLLINLEDSGESASYGMFLGGDFPISIYTNPEGQTGRNLMIVKDSYANAFVPWIASSFDKIVIVDPRFFKGNIYDLVQAEEISDFIVVDYIMATSLQGFIDYLHELGSPVDLPLEEGQSPSGEEEGQIDDSQVDVVE